MEELLNYLASDSDCLSVAHSGNKVPKQWDAFTRGLSTISTGSTQYRFHSSPSCTHFLKVHEFVTETLFCYATFPTGLAPGPPRGGGGTPHVNTVFWWCHNFKTIYNAPKSLDRGRNLDRDREKILHVFS